MKRQRETRFTSAHPVVAGLGMRREMLTVTGWSARFPRVGVRILLTGVLFIGITGGLPQDVSATSPSSTSDAPNAEEAGESELLQIILATTEQALSTRHIAFIEENVVLPGYHPEPGADIRAEWSALPYPKVGDALQFDY